MTVGELREHLSFLDNPDEEIKMCHKGVIVPINTVVAETTFIFLDSAIYEPIEMEVDEMSLGKTIQSLQNLQPETPVITISKVQPINHEDLRKFSNLRLIKGES